MKRRFPAQQACQYRGISGPVHFRQANDIQAVASNRQKLGLVEILRELGPGVVSGSADNDPAGLTTYSVVGAQNGYTQLWLLFIATLTSA
jgi:hypothetical protein